MKPQLVRLENWAKAVYGHDAPSIHTLRLWVRTQRIWPAPVLHGRSYYVDPDATYHDPKGPPLAPPSGKPRGSLAKKLLGEADRG